jgi:hypothetical protein
VELATLIVAILGLLTALVFGVLVVALALPGAAVALLDLHDRANTWKRLRSRRTPGTANRRARGRVLAHVVVAEVEQVQQELVVEVALEVLNVVNVPDVVDGDNRGRARCFPDP